MKDKIIIAYYIGIGNLDQSDVREYVDRNSHTRKDKDLVQYFIPVRDESNVRVECVYPKYVLSEEVDEDFKSVIKRLDEHVKNITDEQQD